MKLKQNAVIFDIDGTIADVRHRLHLIGDGEKKWDEFFAASHNDTVIEGSAILYDMASRFVQILFVTARPESYAEDTIKWLHDVFGVWDGVILHENLFMRKDGDYRKDTLAKQDILHELQKKYNILFAVEDRVAVANMYRANGVWTLHCESDDHTPEYNSGELVLMVGPSGAGKSTFINKMKEDAWKHHTVVSTDYLREQICGNYADQSKNQQVFDAAHALIKTNLEHGISTVVDATNIRDRDRKVILELAPKQCKIYYYVINRSVEEKLKTGGWRLSVPDLIERHENVFQSNLRNILSGDGDERVSVLRIS